MQSSQGEVTSILLQRMHETVCLLHLVQSSVAPRTVQPECNRCETLSEQAREEAYVVFGYYTIFATLTLVYYSITTSNYTVNLRKLLSSTSLVKLVVQPYRPMPQEL